ncbi:MAG: UDP-N-acetylglucosamine 1-carboxyvinyltransferase [Pseudomonadota bacterium]|jgi:UDP-N-acetylglucosamine 1-carboxyvinyltransferase|nr:UDP-N-acetylglucosamine 1-carboxyvinyltransferase [Alphaproteobacteria bacterium]
MPTILKIQGGKPLKGTIEISGAKNSALPLMVACLLTDKPFILSNVPNLADIRTITQVLETLGVIAHEDGNTRTLNASNIISTTAPYELVKTMRASVLVLGPLLARFGHAKVSLPGGCALGARAIDVHLEGLRAMGVTCDLEEGYVIAKAPKDGLKGAHFTMRVVSVGATENLMLAASIAKGETVLQNAAREPEIIDLANCLNAMGADVQGAGTDTITIQGVDSLNGTQYKVMPDRLETGSYAMASLITGGDLTLTNTSLKYLPMVRETLEKAGAVFEELDNGFRVAQKGPIIGVDVMTEPYPGFATDLQAPFMALMSVCEGASMITETIFENRFMHVPELARMGANIQVHGASAMIRGVKNLSGAPVMATDIRAGIGMVVAALAAKGETTISRLYHLDRGYETLEAKLQACGAVVERHKAEI